jgi:hypothetical protein
MLVGFLFGVKGRSVDGKIWAVRMTGGQTKIVKSNKPLTAVEVKRIYRKNVKVTSTLVDKDPDMPWPLLQAISEQTMQEKYSWCLQQHSMTGTFLSLIEVNNGVPVVRRARKQNLRAGGESGE